MSGHYTFSYPKGFRERLKEQGRALRHFERLVGDRPEWKKLREAHWEFLQRCIAALSIRDYYEQFVPPLKSRRGEKWRYISALVWAERRHGHDKEELRRKQVEIEVELLFREMLYGGKKRAHADLDLKDSALRRRYHDLVAAHALLLRKVQGGLLWGDSGQLAALLDLSGLGFKLSGRKVSRITWRVNTALRSFAGRLRYPQSAHIMHRLARTTHQVKV